MEQIRLTQFSKGSGCGCKIGPDQLKEIIGDNNKIYHDLNLLVGNKYNDDAAVYAINKQQAIISTTDFFSAIVDDPYYFGKIAACNAISDIYAMGGKPLTALAILGWPVEKIPLSLATEVMNGARDICVEAGIALCGGHSVETSEPLFGLSVNGIIHPQQIKKNNTAQPGDLLFLSKPLGLGILSTAYKRGIIDSEHEKTMLQLMCTLNSIGEKLGCLNYVTALTDVTGFGLLGHASEMAQGSYLSLEINLIHLPRIDGIQKYISQFCYPDITTKNFNAFSPHTAGMEGLEFLTLCDPQTSGGLLIAVKPDKADEFLEITSDCDFFQTLRKPIGKFLNRSNKLIYINK